MFRPRANGGPDPSETEAIEGLCEILGPLADPARAAVRDPEIVIDRCEVAAEGDVARLQVDADARGLERSSTRIDLPRIVSEQREVARVRSGDDARGGRIDEAIHPVRREPAEVRFRRGFLVCL